MIHNKSVLAIIPARGGSKGMPRKNIMNLCGKPLIAWPIQAAKESMYVDRVILSTDDLEIADEGTQQGAEVPFLRPSELATDTATSVSVIEHAIEFLPHLFLSSNMRLNFCPDKVTNMTTAYSLNRLLR